MCVYMLYKGSNSLPFLEVLQSPQESVYCSLLYTLLFRSTPISLK